MSLTYTAYTARKLIKVGGIGLISFTVIWTLSVAAIAAWKAAHPRYVAPNLYYGILPKTIFPEKKYSVKTFSAELPNDKFPKFKDQVKVYFIARPNTTFLALEQDKKTAKDMGFADEPKGVGYGIYEFNNPTLNLKLTMNVLDGSFKLKYPYESDQLLMNPERVPGKEEAVEIAKSYLKKAGKLPTDLADGVMKVSYWKIEFDGLKTVASQSEANVAKVDFFRKNLEADYKIVSTEVNSAAISVVVNGSGMEGKKVIEVSYKYANIDRESFGTYPIKTAEAAYAELLTGNYWPAMDSPKETVVIRKIYLGYFEPVTLTNYLQPMYVFEGDNNFVAYQPAIMGKYIQTK